MSSRNQTGPAPTYQKLEPTENDPEFDQFLASLDERVAANTNFWKDPIFTTDAIGLYETYLDEIPSSRRQHYRCTTCRRFIERYGHLVRIDEKGHHRSIIWNSSAPHFAACKLHVERSGVNGVFYSNEYAWGVRNTGLWTHLSVRAGTRWIHPTKSAEQAMAEKLEDFKNVSYALTIFNRETLMIAEHLLKSEQLYRSEKVLGPVEWLKALHDEAITKDGRLQNKNIIWRAVASAPAGFCHPRASMVRTLLEDIRSGLPRTLVKERFAAKMSPAVYQRPTAPPKAQNLARAEGLVERLDAAGALARRFARIDELKLAWRPRRVVAGIGVGGVFGHLRQPPSAHGTRTSPITMTWVKFAERVLPAAEQIHYIPSHERRPYCALVTCVDPNARPILQWDREGARNPVSWYVYVSGSTPEDWSLTSGRKVAVTGICLKPSQWQAGYDHHGNGVIFLLEGARDRGNPGIGLFPEILKPEFREIRSSMEAYSRSKRIQVEGMPACGLLMAHVGTWNQAFHVLAGGVIQTYVIDRWD